MNHRTLCLLSLGSILLLASCETTNGTPSAADVRRTANAQAAANKAAPATPNNHLITGRDRHGMPTYNDRARSRLVRATAYYHGEADHIQYGKKSAYGTELRAGRVRSAAADWSRYPVGTVFKIKGLPHTFVIDDYGSALVGTNTVDIYMTSRRDMDRWGVRHIQIEILRMGCFDTSHRILSQRVKHPHCRQMANAIRSSKPWVVDRARATSPATRTRS